MSGFVDGELLRNKQLEAAIAEEPYDEERWIVLEDWLIEQRDPRSVIVQLEKRKKWTGAQRVRERLYPKLLGTDDPSAVFAGDWRAGYLRECRFTGHAHEVAGLVRMPAARLLRAITVSFAKGMEEAANVVAKSACAKSLRTLVVSSVSNHALTFTWSALDRLPRVHRLELRGAYIESDVIDRVTWLVIAPTSYDLDNVAPFIRRARFIDVEELTIDLRNLAEPRFVQTSYQPILDGDFAPRLQRLHIRNPPSDITRDWIFARLAAKLAHVQIAVSP